MKMPKHMLVVSDYASVTQKNTKAIWQIDDIQTGFESTEDK